MSATNLLETERRAYNLRTKQFTTTATKLTYTAKTGRIAQDDSVVDAVIRVTTASTYDLAITIPDGVYYGQELLVLYEVEGDDGEITTTTTTGDNGSALTAAGDYTIFYWCGDTLGWAVLYEDAT